MVTSPARSDIEVPNVHIDGFSPAQTIDNSAVALGIGNGLGRIKQSCEACVKSKVKCSSTFPTCARCQKRGTVCIYAQEKKRGRPLKNKDGSKSSNDESQTTASSASSVTPPTTTSTAVRSTAEVSVVKKAKNPIASVTVPAMAEGKKCAPSFCWTNIMMDNGNSSNANKQVSLDILETTSVERRVFHTFFSLYKHHSAPSSCCSAWFTLQLNKMRAFLNMHGKRKSLTKLTKWMMSHGVSISENLDPKEFYTIGKPVEMRGMFVPPPVHGISPMLTEVPTDNYSNFRALNYSAPTDQPDLNKLNESPVVYTLDGTALQADPLIAAQIEAMAKPTSTVPYLRLSFSSLESTGYVNQPFTNTFGYSTADIQAIIDYFLGGLLPWGGDVLSQLLSPEEDIIQYLHLLAIRFKRVMTPDMMPPAYPCLREPYIVHELVALTRTGTKIPCLCPSVVREVLSLKGSKVEIHMQFMPKQFSGQNQCSIIQQMQPDMQATPFTFPNTYNPVTIPAQPTPLFYPNNSPSNIKQVQSTVIPSLSDNDEAMLKDFDNTQISSNEDDQWMESLLSWVDDAN